MGGLLNCILRFKPFSDFKIVDVLLNGWISFRNICRSVANFFLSSQKRSRKICWSSLRVCARSRDPEKVRKIWQAREQIYIKCVHSHRKQISRWSEQISIFVIHLSWLRNLSIFLQSILIDFKLQGVFFILNTFNTAYLTLKFSDLRKIGHFSHLHLMRYLVIALILWSDRYFEVKTRTQEIV